MLYTNILYFTLSVRVSNVRIILVSTLASVIKVKCFLRNSFDLIRYMLVDESNGLNRFWLFFQYLNALWVL